ncbi:MAG: hypothetical protein HN566_11755 [Polaribacter sp.]|jgi:dTDP-4-dehydrorhamnose 3,5-epimerase-like enzyme|nr:hypothetical protein [Polaribacter sp.]
MKILTIDKCTDHRGVLVFANEFNTSLFKRCYHITHDKTNVIRAWQGHQNESKAFWVTKGEFLLQWIAIDTFQNTDKNLKIERIKLSFETPKILILPGGFANGFQALEEHSSLMIFSSMTVEKSREDDYRWESNYFINSQWK